MITRARPYNHKVNEYILTADVKNVDAEFIAHAREDIPALMNEVYRLNAALNELTAERNRLKTRCQALERAAKEFCGFNCRNYTGGNSYEFHRCDHESDDCKMYELDEARFAEEAEAC